MLSIFFTSDKIKKKSKIKSWVSANTWWITFKSVCDDGIICFSPKAHSYTHCTHKSQNNKEKQLSLIRCHMCFSITQNQTSFLFWCPCRVILTSSSSFLQRSTPLALNWLGTKMFINEFMQKTIYFSCELLNSSGIKVTKRQSFLSWKPFNIQSKSDNESFQTILRFPWNFNKEKLTRMSVFKLLFIFC